MQTDTAPYSAYELMREFGPITFDSPVTLEEFSRFNERYPTLKAERTKAGKLTAQLSAPAGYGLKEGHVCGHLYAWNQRAHQRGKVLSPSTGLLLAGEELRSCSSSWISLERLALFLTEPSHKSKWLSAVPEFVVELKSTSDRLAKLKQKMTDTWLANGVLLAWLIDPEEEVAYVYRAGQPEPEEVRDFDNSVLSGETILPGFTFPLAALNV